MELIKAMKDKQQNITFICICISGIGFLFHLTWEYLQCSPFFIHIKTLPTIWSMLSATVGDVTVLWISYLATATVSREILWPWNNQKTLVWLLFVVIAGSIAEGIEYFSINRQLWAYNPINPTIRGVSVVPLFQMAILNSLTVLLTKKLFILRESTN